MNLVKRLFSLLYSRSVELLQMIRECCVYYSRDRVIIASSHRDVRGWTVLGEPISHLPFSAPAESLGNAALRSLESCRDGLSERDFESQEQAFFQTVGVPNWEALEKQYELIQILEGPHDLTVVPMRRCKSGGYISKQGDDYRAAPQELGQLLRRIIDEGPLPIASEYDDDSQNELEEDLEAVDRNASKEAMLKVGDRVSDAFGNCGTVTHVDSEAEHGLGMVTVRFDEGREKIFALVASGLTRVET